MELMERIKAECKSCGYNCIGCRLKDKYGRCNITRMSPDKWDIEAIRKVLGETRDKEDIVVPEKWDLSFLEGYDHLAKGVARKQNEIIDCLEQIAERINRWTR